MRKILATLAVVALVAPAVAAKQKHSTGRERQETMRDFPAGEPGNPREPAKLVTITMQETYDGKMLFAPDRVSVATGQQVKFVLRNLGQVDHSFVIGASDEGAGLPLSTKPTVPNARLVPAETESDLLWRFSKPGRYDFASILPGQASAGMKGTISVGEADGDE